MVRFPAATALARSVWPKRINYNNFTSEVTRHQGSEGTNFEHGLHDVWSVMYRLQE